MNNEVNCKYVCNIEIIILSILDTLKIPGLQLNRSKSLPQTPTTPTIVITQHLGTIHKRRYIKRGGIIL